MKDYSKPAFPVTAPASESGVSLRDYFATQALQSLICATFANKTMSAKDGGKVTEEVLSRQAYHFADAMLMEKGNP